MNVRADGAGTRPPRPTIGRRRFLVGAGSTGLVIASGFHDWLFRRVVADALTVDADGVLTTTLYRPADQLWLRYEFVGLRLSDDGRQLVADGPGRPTVRVHYPAQHVAEAAIGTNQPAGTEPVDHLAADPSRLVFDVEGQRLDLDAPTLLGLADLAGPANGAMDDDTSWLELPTDLAMVPQMGRARADVEPQVRHDVAHLHRTIITDARGGPARLSVVQNLSPPTAAPDPLTGRFPTAAQRNQFVAASQAEGPALARRLWLTPHGASADLEGDWSTVHWTQEIRNGRDEFVEIVTPGFVMPFGHPARWIDTMTRRWVADSRGSTVAVLVSEQFLIVDPSTVGLDAAQQPYGGRAMPFTSVAVEGNEAVPATKEALFGGGGSVPADDAWFVRRDHPTFPVPIQLTYTAHDSAGNPPVTFSLPTVFVAGDLTDETATRNGVRFWYGHASTLQHRTGRPRGDIAWAPEDVPGSRATTAWTSEMVFSLGDPPSGSPTIGLPPLRPTVTGGVVRKTDLEPPGLHPSETTMEVVFPERWLDHGTDPGENPDGAFLELVVPRLYPLGDTARAAMSPDILAGTLNQVLGVGPLLDDPTSGGTWDPAEAFGDTAEILRGVLISALVEVVTDVASAVPGVDIPNLEVEQLSNAVRTTYRWCPEKLENVPAAGFFTTADTRLCIEVESVIALAPDAEPSATITFSVADFTLAVPPGLGLVELDVAELRAVQTSSGSTDFDFDVVDWRLGGDISWLQPIADFLSGGGNGFAIDVGPTSIDTSLTISMPPVPLGLVQISGISIGLSSSFPFRGDAKPTVGVEVGTPSDPVKVAVMFFSGHFFCRLDLSSTGLEKLRVRMAVAAQIVDIETKLAKAHCSVGIAAEFRLASGDVTFIGEVWLEGSFDLAGLVGASLKIVATATYKSSPQTIELSGRVYWSVTALVTIKGNVGIGQHTFQLGGGSSGGGGGTSSWLGPLGQGVGVGVGGTSFGDQHDVESWSVYVAKFAPEPVAPALVA